MRNLGLPPEKYLAQIKLGAPTQLFRPQPRADSRTIVGLSANAFVIAFSASAASDERKGCRYLLQALQGLRIPHLAILIIGYLESPLELNGVEVVSLGYITDAVMLAAALSAADVYVGPSSAETFGQVFIEAALSGIPSIGFNQTGVVDAIADGITGLRVEQSPQALGDAINCLYEDTVLLANLRFWAPIHTANEFSLESSYHSLFKVWRSLGLVDKWGIPHKVGFRGSSRYVVDASVSLPNWQALEGLSPIEGPYPTSNISTAFRWCHGSATRIRVNCFEGGPYTLRLSYYSNLFESIYVQVCAERQFVCGIPIDRTDSGIHSTVAIAFDSQPGWNRIDLLPDRLREPTGDEPRALSFMLKDIEVISRKASATVSM
jgi:hypothetical protein